MLLSSGAASTAADDRGFTSLISAAIAAHAEAVRVLLASSGRGVGDGDGGDGDDGDDNGGGGGDNMNGVALVDAACDHGRTALIWAADAGAADVVELLVRAGAKLDAADVGGDTARDRAEYRGHAGIAEALKRLSTESAQL